jgi:hypothetical protein
MPSPALSDSMPGIIPCSASVPLVTFAWLISVLRWISGIPAPAIHREAQINRNNFRIAEEPGCLPSNRNG